MTSKKCRSNRYLPTQFCMPYYLGRKSPMSNGVRFCLENTGFRPLGERSLSSNTYFGKVLKVHMMRMAPQMDLQVNKYCRQVPCTWCLPLYLGQKRQKYKNLKYVGRYRYSISKKGFGRKIGTVPVGTYLPNVSSYLQIYIYLYVLSDLVRCNHKERTQKTLSRVPRNVQQVPRYRVPTYLHFVLTPFFPPHIFLLFWPLLSS